MTDEHQSDIRPISRWGLVAGIGLLGVICLTVIALLQSADASLLRAGRMVPASPVRTRDGGNATLREAATGMRQILIVSPTCDICAAEMVARLTEAERLRSEGRSDGLGEVLLLVIRATSIPRATFMSAFNRLQELEMPTVYIEPVEARAIDVKKVPGMVRLRENGRIESVSYPEEAQLPPPVGTTARG